MPALMILRSSWAAASRRASLGAATGNHERQHGERIRQVRHRAPVGADGRPHTLLISLTQPKTLPV